jgi:DNA-binding PadR family transcriptional regulator
MPEVNATQGSLLGFLHDGPMTGWDLLQRVEGRLSRFWNVTSSHAYRELKNLENRGLVQAGELGARERRPFTITAAGRAAFRTWLHEMPGQEQIRFPLLIRLLFGRHLEPGTLAGFLAEHRRDHAERLDLYRSIPTSDTDTDAVVAFGIAYERAILDWLDNLESTT